MLQGFEYKESHLLNYFFSSQMVLSACFALLVGCVCHRLWEPMGPSSHGPPRRESGTLSSVRPFLLFLLHMLLLWGFWNPAHKETIHYTWVTSGFFLLWTRTDHLLNCPERNGKCRCLGGTWTEKVLGSRLSFQSCGDLLAGLCLFFELSGNHLIYFQGKLQTLVGDQ